MTHNACCEMVLILQWQHVTLDSTNAMMILTAQWEIGKAFIVNVRTDGIIPVVHPGVMTITNYWSLL